MTEHRPIPVVDKTESVGVSGARDQDFYLPYGVESEEQVQMVKQLSYYVIRPS